MHPESEALAIVTQLAAAGHLAYWVGGCVRDRLLGLPAKDFDIATSAHPRQVLKLFPGAELIGAAFGVVLVHRIEVATFRSEGAYHNGRHPSQVSYESEPHLDASRRDFTINAIFYDPLTGAYLDFFDGRRDLAARVIRAVGKPEDRYLEDHLRMLRAIRFAARLDFEIESNTCEAIRLHAPKIVSISAERIREELNRMFTGPDPNRALTLLHQSGLLAALLPDVTLDRFPVPDPSLPLAWAALLQHSADPRQTCNRFRLPNQDTQAILAILASQPLIPKALNLATHAFKRLLRQPGFPDHLRLYGDTPLSATLARKLGTFTSSDLFPAPLLDGADLIALGIPPGPKFKLLLTELEDAQLDETVTTREQAIHLVTNSQIGKL